MDDEMMKKLALLSALHGQNDTDDSDNSDFFVSSIHDAIILLQQHMTPGGAHYRRRLVEFITDPENRVLSECDVYHNFIMDLFRVGDYDLAIQVCDYALECAPYNRDILGDAIKACGDSSQFEKGDKYLERAMQIPRERWSFRLFLYSVDFLKTKLSAYPLDDELYQRALSLADDYIRYLPFDFIIQICEKGLRNTTQEQPSAAIGFFMYRKALALDAKAHAEDFRVPDTVTDALKFYQAAYDLNQDRQYSRTIEQRYAVLRPYAKHFEPLVRRDLYKTEAGKSSELDE